MHGERSPRPERPRDPRQHERLERLRRIARLLDARFGIAGTPLRFGLDSLLGLVPGVGDGVTAAAGLFLLYEAQRLGARKTTLARMTWNLLLDLGVGAIPVAGDLFDFIWKANLRNLRLLEADLAKRKGGGEGA